MSKRLTLAIAMTALLSLAPTSGAVAGIGNGVGGLVAGLGRGAPVETVQYDPSDDADYCWYNEGWRGPGWYWCGYEWNSGFGWGGPYGWLGWGGGPGFPHRRHHRHHHGGGHPWGHRPPTGHGTR